MVKTAGIGAGILGLATALRLQRAGHDITVFDPAPVSGASYAAAGMLAAAGLGLPVSVLEADSPAPDGAHMALVPAGMEQASAAFDADEVFVYATEPLALATDVPEDFLDFITEVRSLPDVLPLAYTQQLRLDVKGRTLSVPIPEEPGPDAVLPAFPTDEAELTSALRALLGGILTLG